MENITKKLHIKRVVLIIIILLWMCVVFSLSSQTGNESDGTSSQIVNIVVNMYEKITDKVITVENIDSLSFAIRKIAHFTLYFIGSIPVLMLFNTYSISKKKVYIYTILFCVLYACSDELHQLFSQDRNGNFIDILIDTSGSVFGIIFVQILSHVIYKLKE